MLDQLRRAILRYNMLSPGDCVAIAVSAGADSVALLAAFRQLAPSLGIHLAVAHANHQLRGEHSEADQAFVEQLAARAGLQCHVHSAPIPAGENIEQAARNARLGFFQHLIATKQVDRVATAHTQDDQAETLLLRLLRGAGPTGLAGILPVTREGLIRPALGIPRQDLRQWANLQNLSWRDDHSNSDPVFARNRLRATLIPQLETDWNPHLKTLLAQTAELIRQDNAYLDAESAREAHRLLSPAVYDSWTLDLDQLRPLPPAMQTRVLRLAIERVRGDLHRIGFDHVQEILALANAPAGDGRLQIPGVDVLRSFAWLRFAPWPSHAPPARNWTLPLTLDRELTLPGDACKLRLCLEPRPEAYNETTDWLDMMSLRAEDLEIRNWRPGDLFQVETGVSAERVKLLFQQCRIPLWERRNWPMITRNDEVVWMFGMGVASGRKASVGSPALAIRVEAPPSAVNMRVRLNLKDSGGRLLR